MRIFDARGLHIGDGHASLAGDDRSAPRGCITAPLWTLSLSACVDLEFPDGRRVPVRILDLVSLDGRDARMNLVVRGAGADSDGNPQERSATP